LTPQYFKNDILKTTLHPFYIKKELRFLSGCLELIILAAYSCRNTQYLYEFKKILQAEHLTRRMSLKSLYPESRDTVPLTDSVYSYEYIPTRTFTQVGPSHLSRLSFSAWLFSPSFYSIHTPHNATAGRQ
jgi:hypothetical protein